MRAARDVKDGVHTSDALLPAAQERTLDERWLAVYCFRPPMPKFFIKTYGCQMNERDSEQVAHSLVARGYERVGHESNADVVLLNTCSVRDMADQKALGKMGMLGRLAKERPHVVFGFLGCMAQARGASLLKDLPHVDLVVGTQKFHRVADYVDDFVTQKDGALGDRALPQIARWMICDFRLLMSRKKPVRNRPFATNE